MRDINANERTEIKYFAPGHMAYTWGNGNWIQAAQLLWHPFVRNVDEEEEVLEDRFLCYR